MGKAFGRLELEITHVLEIKHVLVPCRLWSRGIPDETCWRYWNRDCNWNRIVKLFSRARNVSISSRWCTLRLAETGCLLNPIWRRADAATWSWSGSARVSGGIDSSSGTTARDVVACAALRLCGEYVAGMGWGVFFLHILFAHRILCVLHMSRLKCAKAMLSFQEGLLGHSCAWSVSHVGIKFAHRLSTFLLILC